ncbi:hypothetical protein Bhyg_01902 [Pseudolycoriella hygida]|uniref:Uncharacterized protein n=1 Tax=Pseudolycoriella hygida TaxID=35572 RepID=A0A9Q0S675_9DIPT|nr:hypothetical protein Bhyg_01902 [Pseudolycoriella hygida]
MLNIFLSVYEVLLPVEGGIITMKENNLVIACYKPKTKMNFMLRDYHDDIRQEQMWEMQALSSTQNQNLDTNNSNSSSPENGIISETDSATECSGGMMCNESGSDLNLNNNSHLVHNSEGNGGGAMHLDLSHATNLLGNGNSLISTTGLSTVSAGLTSCPAATVVAMQSDGEKETVYVDANGGILHPALRGIKAVNIAGSLARKRPLLGVPRSSMNPTKRTVMTLLARAKNAQALHGIRTGVASGIDEYVLLHVQP